MTPKPASSTGASTPCPAILRSRPRSRSSRKPPRPGMAIGGSDGGGGTVWESISYDPELNLIYFGVGNGPEWNQGYRSAEQGRQSGSCPRSSRSTPTPAHYVWHYQATPGEEWDYDAVQQLILADLTIDGATRKVLMQANKNGFFYVLDRTDRKADLRPRTSRRSTGRAASTRRPAGRSRTRYPLRQDRQARLPCCRARSAPTAGRPWPSTRRPGLVYIPAQEIGMTYESVKDFKPAAIGWNIGIATTNSGRRRRDI